MKATNVSCVKLKLTIHFNVSSAVPVCCWSKRAVETLLKKINTKPPPPPGVRSPLRECALLYIYIRIFYFILEGSIK